MIPIADINPSKRQPYVTYCLVAINIILYLYGGPFIGNRPHPLSEYTLVPRMIFAGHSAAHGGPPSWITLFSHMFLHANFAHLAGNMLYLWIFGNNIEDALGHIKYLLFYIVCGLCAAFAQIIYDPMSNIPMIGASGAIAGVLGAYLVLYPTAQILTVVFYDIVAVPASVYLGLWFVFQAINSIFAAGAGGMAHGGVAFLAHIGGFIAGIVLIIILNGRHKINNRHKTNAHDFY